MSDHSHTMKLGRFMRRNARAVLAALARSDDPAHRALAEDLAPKIGASLDRLDPLPPVPPGHFGGNRLR